MQSTQIMRFSAERRKVVLTFRKLSQTSHGLEEVNALLIASVAVKYNIKSIKSLKESMSTTTYSVQLFCRLNGFQDIPLTSVCNKQQQLQ